MEKHFLDLLAEEIVQNLIILLYLCLLMTNQILLSHMLIKMAFCTAHTTKIFFQNIINIGLIMTRCKCFLCFGQKKKL